MNLQCKLVILILALTLDDQVHTGEIIGGHEAAPHSRPYMVLLEREMHHDNKYCGGFLLNEDFVMTAAHCKAKSYTILLGVHKFNESKCILNISVEQAFPHTNYNEGGYKNDIMLLKMSSKAHFMENVKPIDLADQGDDSLPQSCTVSGWGTTDSSNKGYMSSKLMEVNVTLMSSDQCSTQKTYCSQGDIGPGVGDSGGPLVCEDGKAYGVVSFTTKLHRDGPRINHYVKISDYRSWIDSIMKK